MHTAQQHTPPQQGNPGKKSPSAYFNLSPDLDGEFQDDGDDNITSDTYVLWQGKITQLVLFGRPLFSIFI